jgi:hypothetical protein
MEIGLLPWNHGELGSVIIWEYWSWPYSLFVHINGNDKLELSGVAAIGNRSTMKQIRKLDLIE